MPSTKPLRKRKKKSGLLDHAAECGWYKAGVRTCDCGAENRPRLRVPRMSLDGTDGIGAYGSQMGRPPLHGESIYVRVHGEVQAKVVKVAKDEGVGRPEAVRRLIARAP